MEVLENQKKKDLNKLLLYSKKVYLLYIDGSIKSTEVCKNDLSIYKKFEFAEKQLPLTVINLKKPNPKYSFFDVEKYKEESNKNRNPYVSEVEICNINGIFVRCNIIKFCRMECSYFKTYIEPCEVKIFGTRQPLIYSNFFCNLPITLRYCIWEESIQDFLQDQNAKPLKCIMNYENEFVLSNNHLRFPDIRIRFLLTRYCNDIVNVTNETVMDYEVFALMEIKSFDNVITSANIRYPVKIVNNKIIVDEQKLESEDYLPYKKSHIKMKKILYSLHQVIQFVYDKTNQNILDLNFWYQKPYSWLLKPKSYLQKIAISKDYKNYHTRNVKFLNTLQSMYNENIQIRLFDVSMYKYKIDSNDEHTNSSYDGISYKYALRKNF